MPVVRKLNAAQWADKNPTLRADEVGIEKDTKKQKLGDGLTPWNKLPYQLNKSSADGRYVSGNPTLVVTYNPNGSVASTTEDGVLSTFTYNVDGTVHTQTRAGITKTFTYDASGRVTGAS